MSSATVANDSIPDGALADNSSLTSIILPSKITTIGQDAFGGISSLTSVTLPSSVVTMGTYAFMGCNALTSIKLPPSVTTIGNYAFCYCSSLTSINLPFSLTYLGNAAFQDCSKLTSITIPPSLTSIADSTFFACSGLTSITIPSSVTSIGNMVFASCNAVKTIYSYSVTPQSLGSYSRVFDGIDTMNCVLYVPYGAKSAYQTAAQWQSFQNIVEIDSTISLVSTAGSAKVITANITGAWTASTDASWLTVSPASGTGSDTLVFTVQANPSTMTRTAVVMVSSQAYIVEQVGDTIFAVSAKTASFPANPDSSTAIAVRANIPWSASCRASWLTVNTDSTSLVLSATVNPTITSRSALVTVLACGKLDTITVTQAAGDTVLQVLTKTVSLPTDKNTTTIAVTSNVNWNTTTNQTWLTITKNASSFTLAVDTNPVTTSRNAIVTVSAGSKLDTITVTQAAGDTTLSVPKTTFSFTDSVKTATVFLSTNVPWTASSSASWLTLNMYKGTGSDSITITAQANTSSSLRTATITITLTDTTLVKEASQLTITVTQEGATAVAMVNNDDFTLYPNPATANVSINTLEPAQIQVYTVGGTLVISTKVNGKEPIATNKLSAGLYVVKITTANEVVTKCLIIE